MFSRIFIFSSRIFTCGCQRGGIPQPLRHYTVSSSSTPGRESKSHLLLLIIPVTTFALGTWQIYRLQWKRNLIKELGDRTTVAPMEIPANMEDMTSKELQYRRVKLRGKFDHSMEMYLMPRTLNEGLASGTGFGRRPKAGAQIITPFQISDSGKRILVNRGWVPKEKMKPETRPEGQVEGEVQIVAFLRQGEKRAPFSPKNSIETNRWHYRDVESMAQITGTLPIQVDADAASTIPGGPIGGQTRVTLRNEHLQYIITWYALSAATAYMYYRLRKKPHTSLG